MKIPFAKVACDGNELRYVQEVLASGWLTTAGKTLEFERRFAEAVGARHACAVNSCTAALHLALEAIGIGPGDQVLVPTLTFTATAEVIRYLGADPVFVDVDYRTGLLAPEILEDALVRHPKVKAVMVVHFGGQAAQMTGRSTPHPASGHLLPSAEKGVSPVEAERVDEMAVGRSQESGIRSHDGGDSAIRREADSLSSSTEERARVRSRLQSSIATGPASDLRPLISGPLAHRMGEGQGEGAPPTSAQRGILDICRHHNVRVIEDAAHAFPTRLNGRMVGGFGDVTCFSFYANKTITTGEGGMLVTEDEAIHRRVKTMRLHGINRDIWDRFTAAKASWEYDVVAPGFKYNLPDLAAAVGLAQLERAESMRAGRQRCFEYYLEHFAGLECVDLPVVQGSLDDHSCHLFWLVLNGSAPISRNRLIELLGEAGIGTSVHYKPLHRMTYYRERYQLSEESFPNAERHWRGCVSLPVYPGLSNEELEYVVAQVKRALDH